MTIIDHISALHGAATKGEWAVDDRGVIAPRKDGCGPRYWRVSLLPTPRACTMHDAEYSARDQANAEFAVQSHNLWPRIERALRAAKAVDDLVMDLHRPEDNLTPEYLTLRAALADLEKA